jgi:DNA excision repair protein ERCC-2
VALSASAEPVLWDGSTVRQVALQHGICPYYLSQELARWADVVVADYHYFYDSAAMLYALAQQQGWRVGVLVDEAHNLLERARSMYTAPLSQFDLAAARRSTTSATGAVKKALDALQRQWNALNKAQAVLPQRATDSEADGASGAQSLPLFAQAAAQTVSASVSPATPAATGLPELCRHPPRCWRPCSVPSGRLPMCRLTRLCLLATRC